MTPHIIPDRGGRLRDDCFYQLAFDDDPVNVGPASIVALSPCQNTGVDSPSLYATVSVLDYPDAALIDCSEWPTHIAAFVYLRPPVRLRLGLGRAVFPISEAAGGAWSGRAVVVDEVANRLQAAGFSGIDLVPTKIVESKCQMTLSPALWFWQPRGRTFIRPFRVQGTQNLCPFCGQHPVVCEECGHLTGFCPKCGGNPHTPKRTTPSDQRLVLCDVNERRQPILDGSRWDGSDCFPCGGSIGVTKRVVDFLLSIHAAPFVAEPCPVWVDKMSKEQLARLEEAKRPVKG